MKLTNIVITFLAIFVLFSVQASAADITLSEVAVGKATGYLPGEQAILSFKVTNTNTTQPKTVSISSNTLTSGSNSIPVTQAKTITVPAAQSLTDTITISIPSTTFAGEYTATLSAKISGVEQDTQQYTLIVNVKSQVSAQSQTISIAPGKTNTKRSISIQNTGSTLLTLTRDSFELASDFDLTDNDDPPNKIIIHFLETSSSTVSISPGETKSINVFLTVPKDQESKVYSGTVRVKEGSNEIGSFTLSIDVGPEICSAGNVGTGIDLDVNDPDNGDEFNPGDTVTVRFNVDNQANKDLDVEVEVILYDTVDNDELDSVDDSDTIDEDNDQDFEFEIPLDTDLKDSSSRYKIFVKAFEDGRESTNCQEDEISIDVVREAHQITVDEVNLVPSTVKCGDTVRLTTSFTNTGSSNERNARLKIVSLPLSIEQFSDTFRIDEDDDARLDFSFVVPKDVSSGEYVIDVEPIISGDASKTGSALLKVNCLATGGEPITPGASQLEIQLVAQVRSLLESKDYDQALQTLLVAESLREGEQYGTLEQEIRDAKTAASTTTTTGGAVSGTGYLPTSKISQFFGSSKNAAIFWIIGDIVLVVIALYFIKLIFTKRQK